MNNSVIVVSPASQLLGLVIEASGEHEEHNILVAPTLAEGRLFTELLAPLALLVDAGLGKEPQELLLAAAHVVGARPTILGGEGDPQSGFRDRIPATPESIRASLAQLCTYQRPASDNDDPLAVIRARYANSLGQKATDLAQRLAAILSDPADSAANQAAQKLAHRFRGSAGTYGFPTFGEVAAAIDNALLDGPDPQDARLHKAASQLALWSTGANPLATAWPVLSLSGGQLLLGELAAHSQGLRVAVKPERQGTTHRGCIGRIVEVDGFDRATTAATGTSETPTTIINTTITTIDSMDDSAIPVDQARERRLLVGADEVQIAATGERFARRALGDRLPALIESWISAPR